MQIQNLCKYYVTDNNMYVCNFIDDMYLYLFHLHIFNELKSSIFRYIANKMIGTVIV